MLDYELFKKAVKERVNDFFVAGDVSAETIKARKNNGIVEGIAVSKKGQRFSKIYYFENMYEEYKSMKDVDITAYIKQIAATLENEAVIDNPIVTKAMNNIEVINSDREEFLSRIYFVLENREQNIDKHYDMPKRELLDCNIIYRCCLDIEAGNVASFVVDNNCANKYGVTEQELYDAAYENTQKMFPINIDTMKNIIMKMMMENGMSYDMADEMTADAKIPMYVATNSRGTDGAACIVYEDVLEELAERVGDDVLIFPSSRHEIIATAASDYPDYKAAAQMVNEINMSQVSLQDRLSNQVYKYDRARHELMQVTHTPNKRLDGKDMQAEKNISAKKTR